MTRHDLKKLFPDLKFPTAKELKAKEDSFSVGDRVKVSDNIRCRQKGKTGTIVRIDPEDKHNWKTFIVKFDDKKYNSMGFQSDYIDKFVEKKASREQYTSGSGKVESYSKDKTRDHDEIVVRLKDGRRLVISNNTKLGIRIEPAEGDRLGFHGFLVNGTNVVHKVHPNKRQRGGWLELAKAAGVHQAGIELRDGSYDDVKKVYDSLSDREKDLITPDRTVYKDVPVLSRTVAYDAGVPVGFADWYGRKGKASLCVAVSKDARGRGLASAMAHDSIRKILRRLREDREEARRRGGEDWENHMAKSRIRRFVWGLADGNDASARAAERAGFTEQVFKRRHKGRRFVLTRSEAEKMDGDAAGKAQEDLPDDDWSKEASMTFYEQGFVKRAEELGYDGFVLLKLADGDMFGRPLPPGAAVLALAPALKWRNSVGTGESWSGRVGDGGAGSGRRSNGHARSHAWTVSPSSIPSAPPEKVESKPVPGESVAGIIRAFSGLGRALNGDVPPPPPPPKVDSDKPPEVVESKSVKTEDPKG